VFSILVYRGSQALPEDLTPDSVAGYVGLAASILFLSPLIYGSYTLIAAIFDVATPMKITGEVLWIEVWRSRGGGENSPAVPWLHHFAVDDGHDDRTVAWACPSEQVHRVSTGDIVTMTVRRWTRRVVELDVREHGRERALKAASSEDTGAIARSAPSGLGGIALATALHAPEIAPTQLMTLDEVGRVFGVHVTAQGQSMAATGPMSMESYQSANGGKRLLLASVASGPAANLVMRLRGRAQPLPGIGDEAYTGEHWAIARRGQHVVVLQLHGDGTRVDPRNVYWLLSTAVSRLPQ
jgi:hypothetical protein